jgi:hypothetical protein
MRKSMPRLAAAQIEELPVVVVIAEGHALLRERRARLVERLGRAQPRGLSEFCQFSVPEHIR